MQPQALASLLMASLALSFTSWGQSSPAQVQAAAELFDGSVTVTVLDHTRHTVNGLKAEAFRVLQDGQPRTIRSVRAQNGPVCIGFVVDKSGSMRGKFGAIASALRDFLDASNPQNRSFVVTFSDASFLDQDFTTNPALVEKAVAMAHARGGTGLYDAIIASADYLAKASACSRRALVIVSDGEDNESRHTLQYTLAALDEDGDPVVYALGLPTGPSRRTPRGRRVLQTIAESTGGLEFVAESPSDLRKIALKLAEVTAHQYTIHYSGPPSSAAGKSNITVELSERHKDWLVRTNVAPRSMVVPVSQPLAH
jgi:Ca-activated chloride channel homolog